MHVLHSTLRNDHANMSSREYDWMIRQETTAVCLTFTTTNMHFDLGMSSEMVMFPFGYKSTLSFTD
jgi:hypothetical protein